MQLADVEATLQQRFQLPETPSVVVPAPHDAIVFSRLRSDQGCVGRSLEVPGEDAFAFQVPLTGRFFGEVWHQARHTRLAPNQPGSAYLFDHNDRPAVSLDRPFDTLRLYIARKTLDELCRENASASSGGLIARHNGEVDWVLHGIAQSVTASLHSNTVPMLFYQHMAMAFHQHICAHYAGTHTAGLPALRGGLAPWQLQRVEDYIDAHLAQDMSISQLAHEAGLSVSHFSRAFKKSTTTTPHQWLIRRRLQRAREQLLQGETPLAQIAIACGFGDQSHLTRVFTQAEGSSPGAWRRLHRR